MPCCKALDLPERGEPRRYGESCAKIEPMADAAEARERLTLVQIAGFRSIAAADVELRDVNVLVGANGAGKSNFIGFLRMAGALVSEFLPRFVQDYGGPNEILHYGTERTNGINGTLCFAGEGGQSMYDFRLEPSGNGTMVVAHEEVMTPPKDGVGSRSPIFQTGGPDSEIPRLAVTLPPSRARDALATIHRMLSEIRIYHFHSSAKTSPMRGPQTLWGSGSLMGRGENTAAMLLRMRDEFPAIYRQIVEEMRRILPEFRDFILEPFSFRGGEQVVLRWLSQNSDYTMGPGQLSDGSIRAVSLLTLLLQPDEWKPSILVIDEPELGLHPYAVGRIGRLIAEAGTTRQVIVSTQSPGLVAQFEPEDVVVVESDHGASTFRRLDRETLGPWLEAYDGDLGRLFEMNVTGGAPG